MASRPDIDDDFEDDDTSLPASESDVDSVEHIAEDEDDAVERSMPLLPPD